jgi:hypothetical protein
VRTRGDIDLLISDHPSSPVNFLLFLIPRKFRKFASHRPSSPP